MVTDLAKELVHRGKLDQKMRNKYLADSSSWDESIDKDNTKFMKNIVSEYGWPKISFVGRKAANTAWLLVQHADHDLAFQKLCLKLMKDLNNLYPEEINRSNIAYLEDRVLVAQGSPQLYGTQFYNRGNSLVPRKIKDRQNLDKRRAWSGLGSFSEYERTMLSKYGKS